MTDFEHVDQTETVSANPELDALSARNIATIRESYLSEAVRLGQFGSVEEASAAIDARREGIEKEHSLTINMSAESLGRLLSLGSHETYWHALDKEAVAPVVGGLALHNGKAIHESYTDLRAAAESGLARFVPKASREARPRYAAIAGPSERDKLVGAARVYGNWWVRLDPRLEDEAIYHFSDSHSSVSKADDGHMFDPAFALNKDDALTAKAITDLTREYNDSLGMSTLPGTGMAVNMDWEKVMFVAGKGPDYVEALVFDDVTPEVIVGVGAIIGSREALSAAGGLVKEHPEILDRITSLKVSGDVSPLVRSWLKARLPEVGQDLIPDDEAVATDKLWGSLDLDSSEGYEDIARVIHKMSVVLSQRLRGNIRYVSPPKDMADSENSRRWDSYIKTLKSELMNATGDYAETVQRLIQLQEARVFFKPSPLSDAEVAAANVPAQ